MRKKMRKNFNKIVLFFIIANILIFINNGFSQSEVESDEEILRKARELRDQGAWSQSIIEYERYLAKNPQSLVGIKETGVVYGWNMEWKDARQQLERYIQQRPDDVEVLEILGNVYLYDGRYKKAKETYEKVLVLDPSLEPKLREKIRQAELLASPYATYSFFYYREKNRKTDYRSTTLQHEWEWYQLIRDNLYIIPFFGIRIDDTIHKYTPIYGMGFNTKVFGDSWFRMDTRFEKNRSINPRATIRSSFIVPKDRDELDITQETVWYWDGNISYSVDVGVSRRFLEDRSLIIRPTLSYDNIKKPSDYFVRIEPQPEGKTGHIDLWTAALTIEKFFGLTDKFGFALGNTFSINTDETKTWIGYGRLDFNITDRIKLFLLGSYGRDTDHYEYLTGSIYTSVIF